MYTFNKIFFKVFLAFFATIIFNAVSAQTSSTTCTQALECLSKSQWVGDGRPLPADDAGFYNVRPTALFRSIFVAPEGAKKLFFDITAAGYYELTVNGKRLSKTSLMPLWSPVAEIIYADTFELNVNDVLLEYPKVNEVTVHLGNGFYNLSPLRFWGSICFRRNMAHGSPVFKAQVRGAKLSAWQWRETSVLRNCVYLGVEMDATRSEDTQWKDAVATVGPSGKIVFSKAPAITYFKKITGPAHWQRAGVQIVDLGENVSGVPECRIRAPKGTRVEFVYGERLWRDGSINPYTQTAGQIKRPNMGGPGAPAIAMQRDTYIASGDPNGEVFMPPFTWHVCRYVEVKGLKDLLKEGDFTFHLVCSDLKDAPKGANYVSSNDDLNRLHQVCRRTFKANLIGVQSDCPGRERLGYGGDIVPTCEAMMLNYDMREFYLKTLADFAAEAARDGWLTETAPYVGIAVGGFGGRSGPISWTLAVPVLMDGLLRNYNEERALEYYPVCARYIRMVNAKCPSGIIPRCIGDHEALERAPDNVTATAHWYQFVSLTASFAKRLGHTEDAQEFDLLAQKIKDAFQRSFVKNGIVANGSQSAQSIGIYLGLIPEAERQAAFDALVKAVEVKNCAPHTGIFSTRYMLMALSEGGRVDLARKIVLHKGYPGWMHMLEKGATTLWETWAESENVYSNCHPMFGSVDEWILKYGECK